MLTQGLRRRVAVVGGGMGGLACARELERLGCEPVVFEAGATVGGRCSSRLTRAGWFDDAAQCVDLTELPFPCPLSGEDLPFAQRWSTPAGVPLADEEDVPARPPRVIGLVGTPTMSALAQALAEPLEVRLQLPITATHRRGGRWLLDSAQGEIDEDFEALVLAVPAPLALPLAGQSVSLSRALSRVSYRSRWVLLLATEQRLDLPVYREIQAAPIERIAAMHAKPGRTEGLQRWFVEADATWSTRHADEDPETVAELLLENLCEHARQTIRPRLLQAQLWRNGVCVEPAPTPAGSWSLWDPDCELGVCGDSVVASRVGLVVRSGTDLARAMVSEWSSSRPLAMPLPGRRQPDPSPIRAAA
jgi:renalase